MKKILALITVSVALTSCFGNTEEVPTDEIPVIENSTGIIDTVEDDSNIDIIEDSTGVVDNVENKTNTGKVVNIKDSEIEKNSDEAILEDEVNDLLDEFIDSLDSYDK